MRVLYYSVAELELPEGPAIHTLNVIRGMQQIGIQTLLLCPKPKREFNQEIPGEVRLIPFWGFSFLRLLFFSFLSFFVALKEIRRFRPDYMYVRELEGHIAVPLAGCLMRVPVIIDVNGPFYLDYVSKRNEEKIGADPKKGFVRWLLLRWRKCWRTLQFSLIKGLTFNSSEWQKDLCDEFKYPIKKTCVVTMYVDSDRFKPIAKATSRRELSLSEDTLVLGYVGSFQPTHDIDLFFKILQKLIEQGIKADLLFVGGGKEMKTYQRKAEKLGLAQKTHFLGWVKHEKIPSCISACDVGLILLKSFERYTAENLLKTKEFLACGIPIIIGGEEAAFAEYPKEGIRFLKSDNPDIASQMILDLSKVKSSEMASTVEFIQKSFSLNVCAKVIVDFFKAVSPKAGSYEEV